MNIYSMISASRSVVLTATFTAFAFSPRPCFAVSSPDRIRDRIAVLSSDAFEGRSPGTEGEEKSVAYIASEFKKIGLEPGNPDGSYFQRVPLVGISSATTADFSAGDKPLTLIPINDYLAVSHRMTPKVEVKSSDLIFVGYGVVAPEYAWDDYKGVDVRGKTVVMLINDPPVPSAADPTRLDENVFRGNAMTYYGRWTYKYEIASEKGAAACLIIHETGPAGYPFAVLVSSHARENFDLVTPDGNASHVAVEGWLTIDGAKKLLTAAGQDFAQLKASAARRDFHPIPLRAKASFSIENTTREIASRNVVATLRGSDPAHRDEWVIYSAHWDHLGRDPRLSGDQIFNGASDNASGVSALLEIAQNFVALPANARPKRSLLFIATTAEEKNLLGARHYAENPLYPLSRTVGNINMDGISLFAPTHDIEIIGSGSTTIEDTAKEIAAADGRILTADTQPEKGYYYRSDHFEFAKVGVPAFYPKAGRQAIGKPDDFIDKKREAYTANDYHKVSDEIKPDWDFQAAVQHIDFLTELGKRLANDETWPEWKPGSEFKARREQMLKK